MKLHPALERWFYSRFPAFTEIQRKTLRHTLAGENTLILAPTGSGKTLAAFLATLSELAALAERGPLPNRVLAVYVSPLKALDRDIHRNLEAPLAAINEALPPAHRIQMEVRTGDTDLSARGKQKRTHPHLLLTTPESLSSLLSQVSWRDGFQTRTVIVDEIHSLAENKRGSLLSLALERMEERASVKLQRIGLSATASPPEAVAQLLCGDRPCAIAKVDLRRAHRLEVAEIPDDFPMPPAGYNPYRIAPIAAGLVEQARCTLLFTTTRSAAERLTLALKILLPEHDDRIAVHHGSVDLGTRQAIESGLATGEWKAVVCSSTLELGVDFSAVDQVLLIGAPRGVSRALQRLGRSGHQVGGVANGVLIPLSLPDLLECVALKRAAANVRLDALRIPQLPLDVLAQALLAMSIERVWDCTHAFEVVRRAGPYRKLTRAAFDSVLEYLAGGGRVLGPYGTYGKITIEGETFRVASQKVARSYYMNAGVISDDFQMRVVTKKNFRLGEVEESFIASLQPGEAFLIAGKTVAVDRVHGNIAVVEPAKGERVATPRWMGNKMSLSTRLAEEERELRRCLRDAWSEGGAKACIRLLERDWKATRNSAERIAGFLERQNKATPIPAYDPVQVERVRSGRSLILIFHVLSNRATNRSLAWVAASRVAKDGSVVANFDDHTFLLSVDARKAPTIEELREAFNPEGWLDQLELTLGSTEALGRQFRSVAEIGQLLPKRNYRGDVPARTSAWNAALLYKTLHQHEPEHPLVQEGIRDMVEDQCDAENALYEAGRIFHANWEIYDLPRPSPFGLALYAAFNRETLVSQDPDQALDELVATLYGEWQEGAA